MRFARLTVLTFLVLALVAAPLAAEAERAPKKPQIGVVYWHAIPVETWLTLAPIRAFLEGLEELHWVKDRDFALEIRTANGQFERVPQLVASLVAQQVDVLFLPRCGPDFHIVRQATRAVPIVIGACTDDLVRKRIVASVERPGGNITGLSELVPELSAKRLSLLKEVVPTLSRVGVLWNPAYADFVADWRELRAAAASMAVTLSPIEAHGPGDRESVLALVVARQRVQGLLGFSDAVHYSYAKYIADLAALTGLPAIYAYREVAEAGGLMSYGPNFVQLFRRAATYVDKVLRGAKPGDLPIEQPTKFELVINLKTAKALGLTIPPAVLARADEVIQ